MNNYVRSLIIGVRLLLALRQQTGTGEVAQFSRQRVRLQAGSHVAARRSRHKAVLKMMREIGLRCGHAARGWSNSTYKGTWDFGNSPAATSKTDGRIQAPSVRGYLAPVYDFIRNRGPHLMH